MLEILFPFGLAAFFLAIVLPLVGFKAKSKLPRQASLVAAGVASVSILLFSLEILLSAKSSSFFAYELTSSFQFSFLIDRLAAFFLFPNRNRFTCGCDLFFSIRRAFGS